VSRTDNIAGVTTQYLWDENSITGYAQVVEEIESGTSVRRYAYGAAGIISQSVYNGAEWNTRYCGKDGTGSIRSLTDESGQVVFERDYDAWGNVLSTLNLEPETLSCYFGLHGEYVDPAVNLVYLRARWYAPDIGRFVAMDSFEGMPEQPISLNKYLSFNANPVNMIDSTGYMADISGVLANQPQVLWPISIPNTTTGIFSKGYNVWITKYKHATFIIYPTNQERWGNKGIFSNFDAKRRKYYATIGAFPLSRLVAVVSGFGIQEHKPRMVAQINNYYDVNERATNEEKLMFGFKEEEDKMIERLLKYADNFNNHYISYSLRPVAGKKEYNSNSFHLGLINATFYLNIPGFVVDENGYIGASNPVPCYLFY